MATVVAGPQGLDMSSLDIGYLLDGAVVTRSATVYGLQLADGELVTFTGSGFQYDGAGVPIGGEITGISNQYLGQSVFQISGFSLPVSVFVDWAANGQTEQALEAVLAGPDTFNGSSSLYGDLLAGLGGNDSLTGSIYGDILDGGAGDNTIFAGDGADTLGAPESTGANYLRGGAGGDIILGGGGYDDVNGNQGDDTISGGEGGDDWLLGGQGDDIIIAFAGNVIINGNLGNDSIDGGDGADTIRGGQGNDALLGEAGNDQLFGDRGDDTISGNAGADTFHFSAASGHDVIVDFNPSQGDRIQLDPGARYTVSQVGADTVVDLGGGDQITLVGIQSTNLPAGWMIGV